MRDALAQASERRMAYLQGCYVKLGLSPARARRNAVLAYSAYIGLVHLRVEAPDSAPTGRALAVYVEHIVEALNPPAEVPISPRRSWPGGAR